MDEDSDESRLRLEWNRLGIHRESAENRLDCSVSLAL